MTDEVRYLGDVQRLTLNDGDRVVLSVPGPISEDCAMRLREAAEHCLGGIQVLVLSDGIKLGVIGAD